MNDNQSPDPMDVLARYAPTTTTLARDWDGVRPADALRTIIDADCVDEPVSLVARAPVARRRRIGSRVPVLVSVGVFGAAAAALVAVLVASLTGVEGGGENLPAGSNSDAFIPPTGLSSVSDVGANQYSYRVNDEVRITFTTQRATGAMSGSPLNNTRMITKHGSGGLFKDYVAPNGTITSLRTGRDQLSCDVFGRQTLTKAYFAALPTDVTALERHLRSTVQGSGSHDEAVFVAVGDMLRDSDGLASPKLRAAMVAVLSRTPGVYLHRDDWDYLKRAALRVDFVDQRIRPGMVESLYFDPKDFRLVEERTSSNHAPSTYNGPSPAYDAPAPRNGTDPGTLGAVTDLTILRSETVVDHLPTLPADCHHD